MAKEIIVDAGPIVAFLSAGDRWHLWAVEQFSRFERFATCDAVLSEACARLEYGGFDRAEAVRLVDQGVIELAFVAGPHISRILGLMEKYRNLPMDFADACLVVMSEQKKDVLLVTTDGDFSVYRRHGREVIPTAVPNPKA
jgi:predicted nucleic acid-binding protein